MGKKFSLFIGTSGYNYSHWQKVFYPQDLPSYKWLEYYCEYFNSVELNVTFYRLPKDTTFLSWYKRSPSRFRFVIKGSRFITHIKRLKDCQDAVNQFFENASNLKEKLIGILWQLPPSFKLDLPRLKEFCNYLKSWRNYHHIFEFRHRSWFSPQVYTFLGRENYTLCIADSPSFPTEEILTSNCLYLRFHGGKRLYGSEYSLDELKQWAEKIKGWLKKVEVAFIFFNNDAYGFAVKNALKLNELLK